MSYTFVMGQDQKLWDGTLRAWGLIAKREVFLSGEGLNKFDPQQLFQRHKKIFFKQKVDHESAIFREMA